MQHLQSGFLKLTLAASILLGVSLALTPAMADSVTFKFTGNVDFLGSNLAGGSSPFSTPPVGIGSGQALEGTFTFTPPTPNIGGIGIASYNNVISNLTFQFAPAPSAPVTTGYSLTSGDTSGDFILVQPNLAFIVDAYNVSVPLPSSGPQVNGHTPQIFAIDLFSNTGVLIPSGTNELPPTPPSLNTVDYNAHRYNFSVIFAGGSNSVVSGTISTLSLVSTPLPPAVILFGAGLVSLIGLGARNWRQRRDGLVAGSKD